MTRPQKLFSVQDLAYKFALPVFLINHHLYFEGLQGFVKLPSGELEFHLTDEGKEYGEEHDTQILWYGSVIPILSQSLNMRVQR